MSSSGYAIVTPYLVPPTLTKAVNHGDGFILDSAIQLIGEFPRHQVSSWAPLSDDAVEKINETRCLILAGANTLKRDFAPLPGLTADALARIKVPVIALGLGHYGVPSETDGLSPASIALIEAMLERFPSFSTRCEGSRAYLAGAMPRRAERFVMTGCPVQMPVDEHDGGFRRKAVYDHLVVTVTDRVKDRVGEQLALLDAARRDVPAKTRTLALHQDHGGTQVRKAAAAMGYRIFHGDDATSYIDLYRNADIHVGNRVHAHLKCLSMRVPSFLTPYDLRQSYFADALGHPLTRDPGAAVAGPWTFDETWSRMQGVAATMRDYVSRIRELL